MTGKDLDLENLPNDDEEQWFQMICIALSFINLIS